ncbi:MAG: hypothetical protein O2887_10315 [Bacteroidetes bacterium]|nr:hypothetical protein [Bacteroidota bacterium]
MAETRTVLIDVQVEDKDFDKEIGQVNQALKENREQIKELSKNYASNATEIAKLESSNRDLSKSKQSLIKESKTEAGSLNALRLQLAQQVKERNELNISTKEGKKAFNEMNKEINNLNEEISGFEEAGGDFKRNVGNYSDALSDSIPAFGGVIQSMQGMTKAALAFIVTPLGLILAAVAAAVALVSNAMDRSEENTNKVRKAFSAFSGIISGVLKALEPLGEYLIDGIVKGFDLAAKAADSAMSILSDGLELLGFDNAAENVREFTKEIKEAVTASSELSDAEAKLKTEQRLAQKVMLDYQKQAEKLRQVRDDETLSFEKRIKANKDLGVVLNKQLAEEKRIAQVALDVANLRIKLDGETSEALDERAEALTNIADIEERITGQRSEQLVNLNSLEKERTQVIQEESDKRKAEAEKLRQDNLKEAEKLRQDNLKEAEKLRQDNLKKLEAANAVELEAFKATLTERERAELEAGIKLNEQKKILAEAGKTDMTAIEEQYIITIAGIKKKADDKAAAEQEQSFVLSKLHKELEKKMGEDAAKSTIFLLSKSSKIAKGIALVDAGRNIALAITRAYSGSPPPFNFIAAATVAAAGAIQLRAIAKSGGGGGAPSVTVPKESGQDRRNRDGTAGGGVKVGGFAGVNASLLSQFSVPAQRTNDTIQGTARAINNMPTFVSVVDINTGIENRAVKVSESQL